jgi:NAD(P)-dependent dehydrogenase (short-subunit alcohol dehydrogenase family)
MASTSTKKTSPHRRALVTGASSGIGRATARLLAAEGYRVALLARREDKLREIEREIAAISAAPALVLPCDLCRPKEIEAAFAKLDLEFGGLDLLVNNAGMGYRARVEELDAALLRQLFETNVIGLLLCCRAALPLLRRSQRPVVVDVASVVGRRGIPGQSAYAASKAAVISIGEALRVEWAREEIAVCTLNPALTATGFFEAQPNPSGLEHPDLSRSLGPEEDARSVLALDREPRAEMSLRQKWRMLALLTLIAPRFADRLLARRLGQEWADPRR